MPRRSLYRAIYFLAITLVLISSTGVAQQPKLRIHTSRDVATNNSPGQRTSTGPRREKPAPSVKAPVYGMNFSPYENGQDPNINPNVSVQQITDRLTIIAPYTKWIHSFSMTTGLENIPPVAHGMGLKVAAGAWISRNSAQNDQEIANLIAAANAGTVDIAVVGSEALLRNDVTTAQLVAYMNYVRQHVPPGVLVTTADVYGVLLDPKNADVLAASDVVFANIYPYWEGRSIDTAVCDMIAAYNQVVAAVPGKQVVISETGWPNGGNTVGAAVPSPANQAKFFLQFETWARGSNVASFWFEGFNEAWKAKYEGPQGAFWGIWDEAGVLKPWMQPVFDGQTEQVICDQIPCGSGDPSIAFSFVPPYGNGGDRLEGNECHVSTAQYGVAVYIFVPGAGGWWTKPTYADPVSRLQSDGTWSCGIVTGGIDNTATKIAAFLIPLTYQPPALGGSATLPDELYHNSVANVQSARSDKHAIWGHITTNNAPVAGVEVDLTGAENATTHTAPDGKYSYPNLATAGPYSVSPISSQYGFVPPNQGFDNLTGVALADFAANPILYKLSVVKTGKGTGVVKSSDGLINCGAVCSSDYLSGSLVTLTAEAAQGFVFAGWTGCDSKYDNVCTMTMSGPRQVQADFEPITYKLSVTGGGSGTGVVKSADRQIFCGTVCSASYRPNANVLLTPLPNGDSAFAGWQGCDSVHGSICVLTMNGGKNVTATFQSRKTAQSRKSVGVPGGRRTPGYAPQ